MRHRDAIDSFRETLEIARDEKVDFLLLGGDLFDVNKPPRRQKHEVTRLLRDFVLSDAQVSLEFLSDPSINFKHSQFPRVNYMDPNLNVGLPIFSIHGNHDDMVRFTSHQVSLEFLSDPSINFKHSQLPRVNYMDPNLNVGLPIFSIHGNHDDMVRFTSHQVSLEFLSDPSINFKHSQFPRVNYMDPNLNVGLPIFSIHGNHDDMVRFTSHQVSLEFLSDPSINFKHSQFPRVNYMDPNLNVGLPIFSIHGNHDDMVRFTSHQVSLEFLSDPSINFKHSQFPRVNYMDPNLNVGLPIFSIHGNHDDMVRFTSHQVSLEFLSDPSINFKHSQFPRVNYMDPNLNVGLPIFSIHGNHDDMVRFTSHQVSLEFLSDPSINFKHSQFPRVNYMDPNLNVGLPIFSIHGNHDDMVRFTSHQVSLEFLSDPSINFKHSQFPRVNYMDPNLNVGLPIFSIHGNHDDMVRFTSHQVSLEFLSDPSINFKHSQFPRVNYMDPNLNVGLPIFSIHGNHDDMVRFTSHQVSLEFLSDPSINFKHSQFPRVNYMDPNLNVGLPIFSIHGNHDDMVRFTSHQVSLEFLSDPSINFKHSQFPRVNYMDPNLNVGLPIFSIHGNHNDMVRFTSHQVSLEFLSDPSINFKHSQFPRVNYMDPNLNVGLPIFSIHGNHDDMVRFTSHQVSLEFLSDPSINFKHSQFPRVNYMDPNLNVGLPIFSIHGNHDDMAGGELCALDEFHEMGLLNLFGKITTIDEVTVDPILLRKGRTRVALFGLGAQKDERLNVAFANQKVTFNRPSEEPDAWFNLFALHQTRTDYARDNKKFISESVLPDFLHLTVWGHEHRCFIDPHLDDDVREPKRLSGRAETLDQESERGWVMQPGSSVATSLDRAEAGKKYISLIEVQETAWRQRPIRLHSVRPFLVPEEDIHLREVRDNIGYQTGARFQQDNEKVAEAHCKQIIEGLIAKAEMPNHPLAKWPPLIRIRVDLTGMEDARFNVRVFGQQFTKKVANPRDLIVFYSNNRTRKGVEGLDKQTLDELQAREQLNSVEDFVTKYFENTDAKEKAGDAVDGVLKVLTRHTCAKAGSIFLSGEGDHERNFTTVLNAQEKKIIQVLASQLPDRPSEEDVALKLDELREVRLDLEHQARDVKEDPHDPASAAHNTSNPANLTMDQLEITDAEVQALVGTQVTGTVAPAAPSQPLATSSRRGSRAAASAAPSQLPSALPSAPLAASTPGFPAPTQSRASNVFAAPSQARSGRGKRTQPASKEDEDFHPPSSAAPSQRRPGAKNSKIGRL